MANLLGMIRDPLRDTVSPLLQVCPFVSKAGDTPLIQQKNIMFSSSKYGYCRKRRASEKTPEIYHCASMVIFYTVCVKSLVILYKP